jgi:putative ABC transport system permease protein
VAAIRRFLLRLLSFFRSGRAEADLAREIDSHLQLLEDELLAQGMSAGEARFAARRAFGGVEQAKELQRDVRSFRSLDAWWLDFKLGARMLIKYRGLTLIGGLGMAVAIAIAAGAFVAIRLLLDPALPLDEGDRVVSIQNWDAAANTPERRSLHDLATWRDELKSVEDVGGFRHVGRNLIAAGAQPEVVRVAEMTASGFRVARVPPLLGRHLLAADQREGAPPVVVIGYEVWRTRFAGDPGIVGRTLQLGSTTYSIVGVMPEGFAFPVNHRFWVPLRADPSRYERRQGPEILAFGRLAPGVTLEAAQSELTRIGQRTATAFPQTHQQLRPHVLPYTYPFFDLDEPETAWMLHLMQLLVTLLLVVVSVNVAILVYARTATRQGEIAVRTALGASRRRIVAQLFAEALVLSAGAAAVGLALATAALRQVDSALLQMGLGRPFWMSFELSSGAVAYVLALTVLAAAIVGVLPAVKATGSVQAALKSVGMGGSGMQLGKTWTVLIVAQVAFAVALLPAAVFHAWSSIRYGIADPGFAAKELLTAQLMMDQAAPPDAESGADERQLASRSRDRFAELVRRLKAEPGVSDVTFALDVPGEEPTVWIEADGVPRPVESGSGSGGYAVRSGSKSGHEVRFSRVDVDFFAALDVPVLTGRAFKAGDAGAAASAVIVNRAFVQKILGDGNAVGRRVRYVGTSADADPEDVELGRWYEIVGVVSDFPAKAMEAGLADAKLYHAAAPGQVYPVSLALRVRGAAPATFAGRLREITAAVDPDLQLRNVLTMDDVLRKEQGMMRLAAAALALLTLSVVLLSSAGIYALMSFTVAQRRKEIGIRAALGADPRRILRSIFSRALGQLAIGAVLGATAAALLEGLTRGELLQGNGSVVLPVVAGVMLVVGLLAAVGPARRGLQIHPTEALRE